MSQADGVIQNGTGSSVRVDLNNNFGALLTNSEGSTAPAATFECQFWADSGSDNALKIRSTANDAWYTIGSLDTANLGLATLSGPTFTGGVSIIDGTASAPAIKFANDTDTGIFGTVGQVKVATAGNNQFSFSNTYFTASVPVSLADGAATAPSLTNTGDTNTGLYFPDADAVGVAAAGALQYSFDATSFEVKSQNEIRFNDNDNSHYIGLKAGTLSANQTFTLPTADGTDGQVMKTNGSGQLSFTTLGVPDGVPSGSVFCMATTTVPSGYLECDGSDVSRSTYSGLFTAIGTTWGSGDGSTTFTLPDLRGEFIRGWSNGRTGVDETRTFASAQGDQVEQHQHTFTRTGGGAVQSGGGASGTQSVTQNTGNYPLTANIVDDNETRPRNIAMMYVIKT